MCRRGNGILPGKNAFWARRSITDESLPIEYSITGCANSAAASRRMWMLSDSSDLRGFKGLGACVPFPSLLAEACVDLRSSTSDICVIELRVKTKKPTCQVPAVGWLESCIKSFYKAGFSPIQDAAALAVICRRQQAAVIGVNILTRTNDTQSM